MNGMITGVLLDGIKVGNKRMTHLQAHFHLEVWISVSRVVLRDLNTRLLFGTRWWVHVSDSQQNWSGNENSFWELVERVWNERPHSSIST